MFRIFTCRPTKIVNKNHIVTWRQIYVQIWNCIENTNILVPINIILTYLGSLYIFLNVTLVTLLGVSLRLLLNIFSTFSTHSYYVPNNLILHNIKYLAHFICLKWSEVFAENLKQNCSKVFEYFSNFLTDLVLWDLEVSPVNVWSKSDDLKKIKIIRLLFLTIKKTIDLGVKRKNRGNFICVLFRRDLGFW